MPPIPRRSKTLEVHALVAHMSWLLPWHTERVHVVAVLLHRHRDASLLRLHLRLLLQSLLQWWRSIFG